MFSSNTSQVSDDKLFVEDCFSCFVYTGNGSTQTITNGIDLAGKGGLVWCKQRAPNAGFSHALFDTSRGVNRFLISDGTNAELTASSNTLTAFNSNGFSLGADTTYGLVNQNNCTFASWTFRKAPKFFDVVTFTANSSGVGTFNHALGSSPGVVILKATGISEAWYVYHRSLANTDGLFLNTTDASTNFGVGANWLTATSTSVTAKVLTANQTYVAYLFAHDTTSDGIIQCGSYTGNGSATGPTVTLGWEPQWLLVKDATSAWDWRIVDNMRGMPVGSGAASLFPNLSNAEFTTSTVAFSPTATGFQVAGSAAQINTSGNTYIYIAIRRGPMRTPTSGTSVFSPNAYSTTSSNFAVTTNFPVDLSIGRPRTVVEGGLPFVIDRLRGTTTNAGKALTTSSTDVEGTLPSAGFGYDRNTGYVDNISVPIGYSGQNNIYWNFRRAPSFFDVVCYTGTGAAGTITHNLGVAPELVITKGRGSVTNWGVYHASLGATKALLLNSTSAEIVSANYWNNTAPTATQVSLGTTTNSSTTFVAYLFASCPGVSKVGSYTGNGTTQTINCGFAAGARFVLIKRTDSTGDWYVWDTARGMTALTDPYLLMNSTAAETSTLGAVTTTSVGFSVNASVLAAINTSGASYIFLAIA